MAEIFEKDGIIYIRESDGIEHEAGDMAEWQEPVEPEPGELSIVHAKLDLVIAALTTAGTIKVEQIAASALPEAAKTELTSQIAEVQAEAVKV